MAYRARYNNYNNYANNYDNRNNNDFLGARVGEDSCHNKQKHVHEVQGSVKIAEEEEDPHNHRFCTVTEEAIPIGGEEHVHEVCFRTDFFEEHFHEFKGRTGPAIPVGDRHVHFLESVTSEDDGHRHAFEFATLINDPIKKDHKWECKKDHDDHHRRGLAY